MGAGQWNSGREASELPEVRIGAKIALEKGRAGPDSGGLLHEVQPADRSGSTQTSAGRPRVH